MKITGATTTRFASAPPPSVRMRSPGRGVGTSGCLLELHTDEGLTGIAVGRHDVRRQISSLVENFLRDEDPRAAPGLWQRMIDVRRDSARGGLRREAAALLDVALWDLKAKANDEPLWKTLGGSRPRVTAVASCTDPALNGSQPGDWLARFARDFGFRSAMVRATRNAGAVRRTLEQARRILSHGTVDPDLALDAGNWTPKRAIASMRELERRFDLGWIEVPARGRTARDLKEISDSVRAAVCAGRGLHFPEDFLPHFRQRSIDLVQIDIETNGISGALQLADAAFAFELPVMLCAAPGNVQVQLAGAMPYVMNVEVSEPLPPAGRYRTDVRIEDGWAVVGDAAGNGLAIERAVPALAAAKKRPSPRRTTAGRSKP